MDNNINNENLLNNVNNSVSNTTTNFEPSMVKKNEIPFTENINNTNQPLHLEKKINSNVLLSQTQTTQQITGTNPVSSGSIPTTTENFQSINSNATLTQVNNMQTANMDVVKNDGQETVASNEQVAASNNTIDDEDLLKAFIGKNYEKITKKTFNFAGCFFNSIYMFYRKMYLYALITFIFNLIFVYVVNIALIQLVLMIIVGFIINKLYISYSKKKIKEIKATNPQKSIEELKTICSEKGGTNSEGKVALVVFSLYCYIFCYCIYCIKC